MEVPDHDRGQDCEEGVAYTVESGMSPAEILLQISGCYFPTEVGRSERGRGEKVTALQCRMHDEGSTHSLNVRWPAEVLG